MPWIKEEKCIVCGICIEKCQVKAISMQAGKVKINMQDCIRCGTCHRVCPKGAVAHDGDKIPELIKINVEMTKKNMELCAKYLGEENESEKCLERMKKHFNKEKVVAEKTLEEIAKLK